MRTVSFVSLGFFLCLALSLNVISDDGSEWPAYGGDSKGSRYSPLTQINRTNVQKLKVAWEYRTGDLSDGSVFPAVSAFECTPLVVDGILYLTTPFCRVIALEAETGKEIWSFDPRLDQTRAYPQYANRGVAVWENGSEKRVFLGTLDGRLFALHSADGSPVEEFGTGGFVDLRRNVAEGYEDRLYGLTSPPLIYQDHVIAGSVASDVEPQGPAGDVRAFDVRTGRLAWRFRTVPQPGEAGHDTWEGDSWKGRGGVNAWAPLSCDEERGIVFLPLTSPAYDAYGGDRKGQNLFGDSLVALDALTGKRLWHFQLLRHDIWDWDLPAQPTLADIRQDGRDVPAVVQVTKMGLVFVFNRITGEPFFGIEEREVPASTVPGEEAWSTQPFPKKPPPIARQTMTKEEITNVTPESRSECLDILETAGIAKLYEPWGLELSVHFPGGNGGANWGGAAYDPDNNMLYINTMDVGSVGKLVKSREGSKLPYRFGYHKWFLDSKGYPCQQPPWGQLTAIDLSGGEIQWKVPLGIVDELIARGVPATGTPNIGGPIVTAGGLVFIAASNDSRFRAFDSETGKELWVTKLPASGHATPMTFLGGKSGKQFVVIAAGGGNRYSKTFGDTLVAYSLP